LHIDFYDISFDHLILGRLSAGINGLENNRERFGATPGIERSGLGICNGSCAIAE
jgi:hypothetical protein